MTNRFANIFFSSIVVIGCIVFGIIAAGFENPGALAGSQVPTQVFPLILVTFTGVCSLLNILGYIRGDPEGDADEPFDMNIDILIRMVLMVGILVSSFFLWDWVGFVPTSIFMSVGIAAVLRVTNVMVYVGLAIYGPLIWAVFTYGLGVRL